MGAMEAQGKSGTGRCTRRLGEKQSGRGWTVLYDGDCGFCKWSLALLLRLDREGRLRPLPLQAPAAEPLLGDLEPEQRLASFHLVAPNGERRSGGAALPELLRQLRGCSLPAALFARFPGATDRGYRWVATHRVGLSRWVPRRWKRQATARVRAREGRATSGDFSSL